MDPILIKKSEADLRHQYNFLKGVENALELKSHKAAITIIGGLSLIYLALLTLTSTEILITLKAVSSILMILVWIGSFIYAIWFFIKLQRRNRVIEKFISKRLSEENDHYLLFDEACLIVQTADCKFELGWTFFKAYLESGAAIFLFPEGPIYGAYSFSAREIGEQNFEELKNIAKRKLKQLGMEGV